MAQANFSTQHFRKLLVLCLSWPLVRTLLPTLDYPKASQVTGDRIVLKLKPSFHRAFDITISLMAFLSKVLFLLTYNWIDPLEQDIVQKIKWLIKYHEFITTLNYLLSFGHWIDLIRHYLPFHLDYYIPENVIPSDFQEFIQISGVRKK